MKIAIYGRSIDSNSSGHVQEMFNLLFENGITPVVYEPLYRYINTKINYSGKAELFNTSEDIRNDVDFLFSLGGDGTLLETIEFIKDSGLPVMGINTGRLGFLSSIYKEEIQDALNAILKNTYILDKRTLIELESPNIKGFYRYALNDITVHKSDASAMLTVHASINGEFLNTYHSDGLIIATPTGSTAYSLSCGGPVVMPDSENLIVTPVAPHNLNVRPIVIPDDSIIKLAIESRIPRYTITLDSRSINIDIKNEVVIKKADFTINIIKFENHNFLKTLRNKLSWGFDKRN